MLYTGTLILIYACRILILGLADLADFAVTFLFFLNLSELLAEVVVVLLQMTIRLPLSARGRDILRL